MKTLPFPPGLYQQSLIDSLFRPLEQRGFWIALLVTVVLYLSILAAMQRLGTGSRRRLTVVCTFVAGLFYALCFFLPPGDRLEGTLTAGSGSYEFGGDIVYRHEEFPRLLNAEEEEEPAPAGEGPPPDRLLEGQVTINEDAESPEPGRDLLPITGEQLPGQPWTLTIALPDGEIPLTAAADGTTFAGVVPSLGGPVTLSIREPLAWNLLKAYEQPLGDFQSVLSSFGIGLGIISLCMLHGRRLAQRRPGWHNSVAFFLGFLAMTYFGLANLTVEEEKARAEADAAAAGLEAPADEGAQPVPLVGAVYEVLFKGLYQPLEATTFALLGFYIVSAAYRAFRIRSTEAALITVVAFVMMLGQVPLGQALTSWIPDGHPMAWLRLENVTNWLLTGPAAAAFRGILFGTFMGSFALSLRVWLSLERGSYFGKEF